MQCGGQVVPILSVRNGLAITAAMTTSMKICTCSIAVVGKSKENHPSEQWHIVPEDTYGAAVTFVLNSPALDIKAATKWDGCTDLWITEKSANKEDEECYHHICDLDEFIAQLQEVRAKGCAFFYGEFGVAPLTEEQRQQKIVALHQEEQQV